MKLISSCTATHMDSGVNKRSTDPSGKCDRKLSNRGILGERKEKKVKANKY